MKKNIIFWLILSTTMFVFAQQRPTTRPATGARPVGNAPAANQQGQNSQRQDLYFPEWRIEFIGGPAPEGFVSKMTEEVKNNEGRKQLETLFNNGEIALNDSRTTMFGPEEKIRSAIDYYSQAISLLETRGIDLNWTNNADIKLIQAEIYLRLAGCYASLQARPMLQEDTVAMLSNLEYENLQKAQNNVAGSKYEKEILTGSIYPQLVQIVLFKHQNIALGKQILEELIKADPKNPSYYMFLFNVASSSNDIGTACAAVKKLLELDPNNNMYQMQARNMGCTN